MKTKSCKVKGRRLQNYVRDVFRRIFDKKLEDGDIESRQMGGNGTDIVLSPAAKRLIKFDIECKNVEKINIWKTIKQAQKNTNADRIPLIVFSRNFEKNYVCLEFEEFLKLIKFEDINNEKTTDKTQCDINI